MVFSYATDGFVFVYDYAVLGVDLHGSIITAGVCEQGIDIGAINGEIRETAVFAV